MSRYSGAPASRIPFMLMASADRMRIRHIRLLDCFRHRDAEASHECSIAAVHMHMSGAKSTMQHAAAVSSRP